MNDTVWTDLLDAIRYRSRYSLRMAWRRVRWWPRCVVGLHYSELWADYGSRDEPPDEYYHCAACGYECYPLRLRFGFWLERLPGYETLADWEYRYHRWRGHVE